MGKIWLAMSDTKRRSGKEYDMRPHTHRDSNSIATTRKALRIQQGDCCLIPGTLRKKDSPPRRGGSPNLRFPSLDRSPCSDSIPQGLLEQIVQSRPAILDDQNRNLSRTAKNPGQRGFFGVRNSGRGFRSGQRDSYTGRRDPGRRCGCIGDAV